MSTTNNRTSVALGGIVGATAIVASLFALSVGAGAQSTPAPEAPASAQLDIDPGAAGTIVDEFSELSEHGSEVRIAVAVEEDEMDPNAVIIEMTDTQLTEYHLGAEAGEAGEGIVVEQGEMDPDAEIIEMTDAELVEFDLNE